MIKVLSRYMRLYKAFFFQCLKEDMIYRSNFLTLVIMDIGFVCVSLILFKVIYGHVNTIAGWTFNQSVILIGTVGIVREMAYLTFRRGFLELGNHIRTGTFDMFMVIPIGIIATVPASALTGRLGFNFAVLSLFIGISFLCAGLFVWKMSIEHYSSASG